MNRIVILAALVAVASGCTQVQPGQSSSLRAEVSDAQITSDDPGEIVLNAENRGNHTRSFYVTVEPVGDYSEIINVSDRDEQREEGISLGEAVPGATTGQRFATVQKKLNVTSEVKVSATLYQVEGAEELGSSTLTLRTMEE